MSILSWHCRGADNAATVQKLHEIAKKFAPTMLFIAETQIDGARVEMLAGTFDFDNAYVVSSQCRSGGLGISGTIQ